MIDETIELPVNRDPYTLPVTLETWERLPSELLRFFMAGGTAPTELAARVLLNQAERSLVGEVVCHKAVLRRAVVHLGRKAIQTSHKVGRPLYQPGIPARREA